VNRIPREEYLSCRMSLEEREAVRQLARQQDRSESSVIRLALATFIKQQEAQQHNARIGAMSNVGA
jgi:predicted transcriptional regulator